MIFKIRNKDFNSLVDKDREPEHDFIKWIHVRDDAESASKSKDNVETDQEYGEKVTCPPPDVPSDTATNDDSSDAAEHGETEGYLVHVILTDEHGLPKLDDDGNPMTIPGIAPSELQGRYFLRIESDGSMRKDELYNN